MASGACTGFQLYCNAFFISCIQSGSRAASRGEAERLLGTGAPDAGRSRTVPGFPDEFRQGLHHRGDDKQAENLRGEPHFRAGEDREDFEGLHVVVHVDTRDVQILLCEFASGA